MTELEITAIASGIALIIATVLLSILLKKYIKAKEKISELEYLDSPLYKNREIPQRENYTIVDLIYEQNFTNDELLSMDIKEEELTRHLKTEAGKSFILELEKLDAIQMDAIRGPYQRLPNRYRFITKIALRDER